MNKKTENQRARGGFAILVSWILGGTALGLVEMYICAKSPTVNFNGFSLLGSMLYYWIPSLLGGILVWAAVSAASRISGRALNGLAWGCGLFASATTFIYAGYWINNSISGPPYLWPAAAFNVILVFVAVLIGFLAARIAQSLQRSLPGHRALKVTLSVIVAAPLIYFAWSWGNLSWDREAAIERKPDIEHTSDSERGTAERQRPMNVILITIDALRPDHLSINGYERNTSPYLDRLAQEGANFRNAFSQATITVRSMSSVFTSLYPQMHGLMGTGLVLPDSTPTLPEVLADMGYSTAGFAGGNPALFQTEGIVRGYDYYDDCRSIKNLVPKAILRRLGILSRISPNLEATCPSAETTFEKVRSWLRTGPSEPFFLFIHLMDVHSPYLPPGKFASKFGRRKEGAPTDAALNKKLHTLSRKESPLFFKLFESGEFHRMKELNIAPEDIGEDNLKRLIDLYDGGIAYTDSQLESFIEELEAAGIIDRTLLMISADHGEAFLEHGRLFHSGDLVYDELMRVPLIMKCPGVIPAGTSIDPPVGLIDIMPTVLELAYETEWADSPAQPQLELEGKSLLPLFRGDEEGLALRSRGDVYCEGALVACIRTAHWKYIDSRGHNTRELYDLEADPGEKVNLIFQMEEKAAQLAAIFEDYEERIRLYQNRHPGPIPKTVDEETLMRLRSLGYVE